MHFLVLNLQTIIYYFYNFISIAMLIGSDGMVYFAISVSPFPIFFLLEGVKSQIIGQLK